MYHYIRDAKCTVSVVQTQNFKPENCYFLVYFERSSEGQTCATSSHRTGWSLLETTFYSEFTLWQATQIHQTLFLFSFFAGLSQFHLRFFWPFLLLPLLQSSYSLLDSCNATTRNCVLIFTLGEQYKLKTSLLSQTLEFSGLLAGFIPFHFLIGQKFLKVFTNKNIFDDSY